MLLFAGFGLDLELVPTILVPSIDLNIGGGRKDVARQVRWEWFASLWVPQVPVADCILNEGDVSIRVEKNLDRGPA